MEMVPQGVSTRKVTQITQELCGTSFSKSTVSALCKGLDESVRAFRHRLLKKHYPFVMLDAIYLKICRRERVIRIFPNESSAIRLPGALLCEQSERWISGRKCLDMEVYRLSQEPLDESTEVSQVA